MISLSQKCVEVEITKAKLWKKYNDVISDSTGIDTGCHDIEKTRQLLYEYAGKGLVEKLDDTFLEKAASVINIGDDKDNYTPLILGSKNGHVEVVRRLCEGGKANVDLKAGWNQTTALMKAAEKGHEKVAEQLIALNAELNLQNSFKNTALMLASEFGKHEVVEVILTNYEKLDMDVKNEYEYTAIILAAENGHKECVELLIGHGADLNLSNKFGKTAVVMAAENGHYDIVLQLCCSERSDLNQTSKRGVSALMLAAVKGHTTIVRCLTDHDANIHLENNDKTENALTMACQGGKAEIVEHLIDLGADVSYKNTNGDTVLMKACEKGNENIMGKLLAQFTQKDILTSLTAQNKDGNTCLMKACATGNLKVIVYLMNLLKKHLSRSTLGGKLIEEPEAQNHQTAASVGSSSSLTPDQAKTASTFSSQYGHTSTEVLKASYRTISNKDGDTAMTLLSKYYREHPDRFTEFVIEATHSHRRMYLFDMLPSIMPCFDSPNTVLNSCKGELFRRLRLQHGYKADVKLLHALVNIAAALKLSAIKHPLESRDINELYDKVDASLRECMNSTSMDVPLNVMKILRDSDKDGDEAIIVRQALAFVSGPLELCIAHDLTGLLGTAQISTHVATVFWESLKPTNRSIIRELPGLFQVRSGCTTYRYRPAFMFLLEGASKVIYLILVAMVSSEACSRGSANECEAPRNSLDIKEKCIVVMMVTGTMFEMGEMVDRSGILNHLTDVWNFIDVISNSFVAYWFFFRAYPAHHSVARGLLALSAIPMSISLLRFLSFFQHLGQLVIMIFAMSRDLVSFLVVFLISILGFGIAFHSLFPDTSAFSGPGATFLTLFNAALGGHEFETYEGHKYQNLGIATMALYVTFVMIILLNLIIARMSSTHEKINDKSFEQWSMVMAKNVQDCLLINEKNNPLCMLPPPFNAISTAVYPFDYWAKWCRWHKDKETMPSICGSAADCVIGLLTAPVCAAVEVYLVNKELWNSQIPRINALLVSFVSITLFPLWYFFFLAALLASIYDTEGSKISRRDKRIIYDHQKDPKFPLQKSLMAMVFLIFSPAWFLAFCDQAIGTVIYTAVRNRKKELIKKAEEQLMSHMISSSDAPGPLSKYTSMSGIGPNSTFLRRRATLMPTGTGTIQKSYSSSLQHPPLRSSVSSSVDNRSSNTPYLSPLLSRSQSIMGLTGSNPLPRFYAAGSLCHVSSYKAPHIPHTQLFTREEIAMCVFFLFTSPIWFLSIFSVRMAKIITGWTDCDEISVTENKTFYRTQTHDSTSLDWDETFNNETGRVGLFGRKANPYVKATYGSIEKLSPTYVCDNDSPLSDKALVFNVTEVNSLIFEVFDRDTTDSTDSSNGVLMGRVTVDIKEWVANGRFEGEQKLHNREGIDAGDSIQLAVKIAYPKEEISKRNKNQPTTLSPALSEKTDRDERTEPDTSESVERVNNILRDRSISLRSISCEHLASLVTQSRTDSLTNENWKMIQEDDDNDEAPLFKQEDRSRIFSSVLGRSLPDKYELAELAPC